MKIQQDHTIYKYEKKKKQNNFNMTLVIYQ